MGKHKGNRVRKLCRVLLWVFVVLSISSGLTVRTYAVDIEEIKVNGITEQSVMEEPDFGEIDKALEQIQMDYDMDFGQVFRDIMSGKEALNVSLIYEKVLKILTSEVVENRFAITSVILLSVLAAVLSNITTAFQNRQIAKIAFLHYGIADGGSAASVNENNHRNCDENGGKSRYVYGSFAAGLFYGRCICVRFGICFNVLRNGTSGNLSGGGYTCNGCFADDTDLYHIDHHQSYRRRRNSGAAAEVAEEHHSIYFEDRDRSRNRNQYHPEHVYAGASFCQDKHADRCRIHAAGHVGGDGSNMEYGSRFGGID